MSVTADDLKQMTHNADASRRVFAELQRRRASDPKFTVADLWRETIEAPAARTSAAAPAYAAAAAKREQRIHSNQPSNAVESDDEKRAAFDPEAARRVFAARQGLAQYPGEKAQNVSPALTTAARSLELPANIRPAAKTAAAPAASITPAHAVSTPEADTVAKAMEVMMSYIASGGVPGKQPEEVDSAWDTFRRSALSAFGYGGTAGSRSRVDFELAFREGKVKTMSEHAATILQMLADCDGPEAA